MANRDLELALRIKADLAEGQRELEGLSSSIKDVGGTAQQQESRLQALEAQTIAQSLATDRLTESQRNLAASSREASTAQEAIQPTPAEKIKDTADAATAAASAQKNLSQSIQDVGETAQQQESRLQAMVAASLAQRNASEGLSDTQQRVATTAREVSAEWRENAQAQTAAMNTYHNKARADKAAAEASAAAAAALQKESQELGELLGKIDPVIGKLAQLDEMEQRLRRARKVGAIDGTDYDHYNAKLAEQRTRLTGTSDAMKHAGISAGQYQQAMRMLPAQITDITTSLASGMPIWLVAIQQGGQIKDSFGGMGNAGRALLSVFNPLTLAIAAAAAVAATLLVAYQQGSKEAFEYEKALIMTGNAAGTSSDQLGAMAARIDGISGTQRQAAAALAEVASTGKFTAAQIELIGTTAVLMQNNIGQAVSVTVDEFKRLADEPAKASAELNQQYNYLTASVYEQIAALEAQGDQAGAAQLAIDALGAAMQTRSTQIAENLGWIEFAWSKLTNAAAKGWDAMLGIGRADTLDSRLKELEDAAANRKMGRSRTAQPLNQAELDEMADLRSKIAARDAAAEAAAADKARQAAAIEAEQELARVREQGLSRAEQKEKAIAEYRANVDKIRAANPNSAAITPEQQAKDLANIEARFAERQARTAKPKIDSELRAQEQYLAQLERQAAVLGMNASEVRQYELAEKGLSGAMRDRAVAALQLLEQAEAKRQADADGKQLAQIEAQLLAGQGQRAAAAALAIEAQYGELMQRLAERGDQAGLALVNSLINVDAARAQLADLQAEVDRIFAEQSRQESSIQAQQQAGLISELGARQRIVDLHAATAAEVEKLLPLMKELAEATGDPAAIERVKDLQAQLEQTKLVANDLKLAFNKGFEEGLAGALQGLATGTMNLQEAATSFVNSIVSSMAQLAAQQLAMKAMASMSGFAGGMGIPGFATGGHVRGAGTGTSDSIPAWLSDYEFVTRSAVVRQPGALEFLNDFNRYGMAALADWAGAVRHNTGGLAGVPAPAMASPNMARMRLAEPAKASPASLNNRVNLYAVQRPEDVAAMAWGKSGQEHFMVYLQQHGAEVRQLLEI